MSADLHETLRFLRQENARLQEENRELREEVELLRAVVDSIRSLHQFAAELSAQTDVVALLDRILYSALRVIDAADGSLLLVDNETGELVFAVVHGAGRERMPGYRIPPGTGIAGWVAQHRQAAIVHDVRRDPRFSALVDEAFGFETNSLLSVPIATATRVLGVLSAVNKFDGREFTESDLALLAIVAQLAGTAMERADKVS